MADYAWTVSIDRQSSLGVAGISGTYIIPRAEMNGFEPHLAEEKLWIILRGQQDRCIAVLTVTRLERFIEGLNTGDFLIYTDLSQSIRLCSNYSEAQHYVMPLKDKSNLGLSVLSGEAVDFIKSAISKNVEVKFTTPSGLPESSSKPLLDNDYEQALFAVTYVVQNMNLNQIWGGATGLKLNPVSNFAKQFLSKFRDPVQDGLLNVLKTINPIKSILDLGETSSPMKMAIETSKRSKFVDLSFTEIDPENIYAREFISGEGTYYNLEAALSKTDVAEKLHQSILRDIAQYLKSIGVSTYESTSIDLMIQTNSKLKIFEIKSVNLDNIIAQTAKGAFQIATYASVLKSEIEKFEAYLIINKIQDERLEAFVQKSLNYLGINYCIYNSELPWPERLPGLLN